MSSKLYLLLISLFFVQVNCYADPISKAIKALKKGKHEQVQSLLIKSIQRNSINPGARYAFSLLYFDSTYTHQNLDSAHIYIEQALIDEQQPDSLEGLSLEKSGLTVEDLHLQKQEIDRQAYQRAVDQNTVESFQFFIDSYSNAPQLANAISRRDLLAFEIASNEHTYQSYKHFIDLYPEAHQVSIARERYDLLVFQAKTTGGKLKDYTAFLKKHPDTPYRNQAEWEIFQLRTLDDNPESYTEFKQEFPSSIYVSVADNILYHKDKESFINNNKVSDSLANIYELESAALIPIYENDRYGFIDRFGNDQIAASVDSIPENYLCQLLTEDVFQAYVDQQLVLMTRNQAILWDRPFDKVEDLGRGLLKINIGSKFGILHKSGWMVLEVDYDHIKLLGDSFLAFRKNDLWGIASMTGRIIVQPRLEMVQSEGPFLLLKKDLWAVSNKKRTLQYYEMDGDFSFLYQDWETISSDYMMVFNGENEGIINSELIPVIPVSEHEIHELDSADWYVKTGHGTVRFYGDNLQSIPPDRYQNFVSNEHYISLLRSPNWEVWDRSTMARINEIDYDSVATLGLHFMLLFDEKGSGVLFRNGKILGLAKNDKVKLIRSADQALGFLQVNTNGGKRQIYDLDGNEVYHTWYYDVSPLTSQTFIIEKNGMKGIVNLQGKVLLKPRYKTIVADSVFHISLLHNGRFGYFNPQNGALIRPQYQSRLIYFNDQVLLTSKEGKQGLIDHNNKTLLPFEYDKIQQWSDSSVIAQNGKQWSIFNYFTGEELYKDIKGIELISNQDGQKAVISTSDGYGLLDNHEGVQLNPGFNDIINLGTAEEPVFFTEKYIPEADYFVVIYYNQKMEVIRKQVFDSGNYDQVYCF